MGYRLTAALLMLFASAPAGADAVNAGPMSAPAAPANAAPATGADCATAVRAAVVQAIAPPVVPPALPPTLPTTTYKAEARTTPTGDKSVWVIIPPTTAGAPPTELNLGPIHKVPAGTQMVHWGTDESITNLVKAGKVTDDEMTGRILGASSGDLDGGGFYVSTDPTDSASYGVRAITVNFSRDAQTVEASWLNRTAPEQLNIIVALRNAGFDGIHETSKPTWFNMFQNGILEHVKELDAKTVITDVAKLDPSQAAYDLVVYDQKSPLSATDLAGGPFSFLGDLMQGKPITDAQKTQALNVMGSQTGMINLLVIRGSNPDFNQTPLFKGVDQLFSATHGGMTLSQFLDQ